MKGLLVKGDGQGWHLRWILDQPCEKGVEQNGLIVPGRTLIVLRVLSCPLRGMCVIEGQW